MADSERRDRKAQRSGPARREYYLKLEDSPVTVSGGQV